MAYTLIVVGIVFIASGVSLLNRRNTKHFSASFKEEQTYLPNQNFVSEDPANYNKEKGKAFEEYVVLKFDKNYFKLIDWRSDKSVGKVYPASNQFPDLKIQYNYSGQIDSFAVECKWRKDYYKQAVEWSKPYQLYNYKKYGSNFNIPVFVAIGVGGLPNKPHDLYIIPINELVTNILTKEELKPCLKNRTQNFFWDTKRKTLR